MMEEQIERCRAEARGIREVKARVEGILDGLGKDAGQAVVVEGEKEGETEAVRRRRRKEEEGRRVWDALERELGDDIGGATTS